jgi:mutator protein MutT
MTGPRIDVVGAVIVHDGLVLCAQRAAGATMPGAWEFPGGKIEPDETPRAALEREIAEELGCRVRATDEVATTTHAYPEVTVTLTTFLCEIVDGIPRPLEHAELRWLRPDELGSVAWAPADLPTVAEVHRIFADDGAADASAPYPFSRGGATIVVEECGDGPATFVLVHGIGLGRGVFAPLVEVLRQHGRVITLDQPGYGEAPEPPRTPTIERVADLVAAFLHERRAPDVTLIGHSMGTQVVIEVAARHPHLISRLVLAAPTVEAGRRKATVQLRRLARDLVAENPTVLVRGTREYVRAGPHLRRKMRAMLVHRPEDAYPRIAAPTLVLRGARDPVCPQPWCERVTAAIPDARLVELPGHGHETLLRAPADAAAEILRFAASTR